MRIIDEATQQEITNPDLTLGNIRDAVWASPEAYASIDNVTKFALEDSDFEHVQIYHRWTDDEIAQREESLRHQERQAVIDALPEVVAGISARVTEGADDTADLADALADLSAIVSTLMEGA